MTVNVYNTQGQVSGQVELPIEVFGIEPHDHAMHMAVRVYLANQRQGTHKVKGRSEVSGGGKKPWKQKGRGTARAGTTRSPLWVGGGKIHGPHPHKYTLDLPKKVKKLARRSALSLRASENNIVVIEGLTPEKISTKVVASTLKALNIYGEKTLQLMPSDNNVLYMSSRNIDRLTTMSCDKVSAYDILCHKKLLLHKGAIETIVNNAK